MGRELKFRAWDGDRMRTDFLLCDNEVYVTDVNGELERVDWIPLQYTGVKDKNGVGIYEGGIVVNERGEKGVISFSSGSFVSVYVPPYDWDPMEPADGLLERQNVIGNIHANPELISK